MFSLHDFLMVGLKDAVGKMADYQVILNAVGWQEKGVLTADDLAELQLMIQAQYPSEMAEDEPMEEMPTEGEVNS